MLLEAGNNVKVLPMTPQYALAKAMATMDGKLDAFLKEADGTIDQSAPNYTGHYDGYLAEASILIEDLAKDSFTITGGHAAVGGLASNA
jgi:hypothetical protein